MSCKNEFVFVGICGKSQHGAQEQNVSFKAAIKTK